MKPDDDLLEALREATTALPRNARLWAHYADLLEAAGRAAEAVAPRRMGLRLDPENAAARLALVRALRRAGELPEALLLAEEALDKEGNPELRVELVRVHRARGDEEGTADLLAALEVEHPEAAARARRDEDPAAEASAAAPTKADTPPAPAVDWGHEDPSEAVDEESMAASYEEEALLAAHEDETPSVEDLESLIDFEDLDTDLGDVVGLDDVKREVRLRVLAPKESPDIYRAFRREGGGGVLLYGPPGCGKTFVARAVAGELSARFTAVGIHEVLDKFYGESEKMIHALFEEARRQTPTVLFFDEFDALGGKRRNSTNAQFWQTLVDQLLNEMDGFGRTNRDVFIFAATNLPWNVDPAFRRPGRFDRVLFVPPPDVEGRKALLSRHLEKLPGGTKLPIGKIAKRTEGLTAADVVALVERAAEGPLARSLESGKIHPLTLKDVEHALERTNSSALEWLAQARNHARYANEGGQYDDLVAWLKAHRKW